jgi:hypothetical protein
MPLDTGYPSADARDDWNRARRRRVLSRLATRLRRAPHDVDVILPYDEAIAALGYVTQRDLGLQVIPVDSVVGSVDRTTDFDRTFLPATNRPKQRFERLAEAVRRGEPIDPIDVIRIGEAHFVKDGHHRVAVLRALAIPTVEAHVVEVVTRVGMGHDVRISDLPLKGSQRLFRERVPLPPAGEERIRLSDPWSYGVLAENVEAWGFRAMQARRELLDRRTVAEAWYREEYLPVVAVLKESGLLDADEPETEGYMRLAGERWRLLQTWSWDDSVIQRLRRVRGAREGSPEIRKRER